MGWAYTNSKMKTSTRANLRKASLWRESWLTRLGRNILATLALALSCTGTGALSSLRELGSTRVSSIKAREKEKVCSNSNLE